MALLTELCATLLQINVLARLFLSARALSLARRQRELGGKVANLANLFFFSLPAYWIPAQKKAAPTLLSAH